MSKIILSLFIVLIISCATSPIPIDPRIIGTWEGKDHTEALVRYTFNSDGSADIVIAGESFQEKISPKGQLLFTFDERKSPNQLTIFAKTDRGDHLIIIKKIVAFVNETQIKTKARRDNTFPKDFSVDSKKTEMLLSRVAL